MRLLPTAAALLALCATPAAATDYPLTVANCGMDVAFKAAPRRVVTFKSTATEMLLALGLGERIVGAGFQDGPPPPDLAPADDLLTILSDKLPSAEVVLEQQPDLVYAGWESNFAGDGAGERAFYEKLGVATYVAPSACQSIRPPRLSFEAIFSEIREMGRIFDVEPAAETLVAGQTRMLAEVKPDGRGLKAAWYSSGVKAPFVGAGANAPAIIMETLGLTNVFAAIDEGWTSVSWEAMAAADPDVIVLVDATWNSVAQKKKLLAENPITAKLGAVIDQRYLVIDFASSQAGVRTAPAVSDLAGQLRRLDFGGR